MGEDGGQASEPHHILEPESVGPDLPCPHPWGLGQAQAKPSFDLSFILSSVPKITNMLVLLSPCPFELLSCAPAARPGTDSVRPKAVTRCVFQMNFLKKG